MAMLGLKRWSSGCSLRFLVVDEVNGFEDVRCVVIRLLSFLLCLR